MNSATSTVGGTERCARLVNALPWLWLGMSAAWAVKKHGRDLTEAQARAACAGNHCRCGT